MKALNFLPALVGREITRSSLADAIDDAQLKDGIALSQVAHLLFTFSGNDPRELLKTHCATTLRLSTTSASSSSTRAT